LTLSVFNNLKTKDEKKIQETINAGLSQFKNEEQRNVYKVKTDGNWKWVSGFAGEPTCCTDKTIFAFALTVKEIIRISNKTPPIILRILAALPKIQKKCPKEGVEVPADAVTYLKRYKNATLKKTGNMILKEYL